MISLRQKEDGSSFLKGDEDKMVNREEGWFEGIKWPLWKGSVRWPENSLDCQVKKFHHEFEAEVINHFHEFM